MVSHKLAPASRRGSRNKSVAHAARNNDFDQFRDVVFEPQFLQTVINQMDANEKIFRTVLSDEHMRSLFATYLARTVYDEVRRQP